VIEICAAEEIPYTETDLALDDVYCAGKMFCTGTMGELAGVIKVDDRIIGDGTVGPMTKGLSELYAQLPRALSSLSLVYVNTESPSGPPHAMPDGSSRPKCATARWQ
jgi:hypothetical protein